MNKRHHYEAEQIEMDFGDEMQETPHLPNAMENVDSMETDFSDSDDLLAKTGGES